MHANLAVAMGGRVAEELIFGYDKVSSGASGDIQQATRLARAMVTMWGMSDKVGPIEHTFADDSYLGSGGLRNAPMSNDTSKLIDSEIKSLVESGLKRARNVLTEHIDKLHLLANALLEYETLTGEEIKKLITTGEIDRADPAGIHKPIPAGGTSIPKIRRPKGPFGNPTPQGA
jgi:cell division protease FtsH